MSLNKFLIAFSLLALVNPAAATPEHRAVDGEPMVVVPELEFMGPSRVSTVKFCAAEVGVSDWRVMMTDSQLENMEVCLAENT